MRGGSLAVIGLKCWFGTAAAMARTTVFITGATDGIGRHTARMFVRERLDGRKASEEGKEENTKGELLLLIHGRDESRLRATKEELLSLAGKESNIEGVLQVETLCAELSCMGEVRRLAEEVKRKADDQLTVFIQNAGVFMPERAFSSEGLETTFAVNVAAPFLLLSLLMPLLTSSHHSRVLMVSSISQHDGGALDLNDLQLVKRGYSSYKTYGNSKLIMAMLAKEAAERVQQQQQQGEQLRPLIYSCDPGTVNTKMLLAGWGRCGIEPQQANDEFTLTRAFDASRHGKYFVGARERKAAEDVYNVEKRRLLWSALETITGAKCL